jgi:hypothetical protein
MLARITVCLGALLTVASFDVSACNSAIFVNAPEHATSSIVLEPPSGPEVQFNSGGFKITVQRDDLLALLNEEHSVLDASGTLKTALRDMADTDRPLVLEQWLAKTGPRLDEAGIDPMERHDRHRWWDRARNDAAWALAAVLMNGRARIVANDGAAPLEQITLDRFVKDCTSGRAFLAPDGKTILSVVDTIIG